MRPALVAFPFLLVLAAPALAQDSADDEALVLAAERFSERHLRGLQRAVQALELAGDASPSELAGSSDLLVAGALGEELSRQSRILDEARTAGYQDLAHGMPNDSSYRHSAVLVFAAQDLGRLHASLDALVRRARRSPGPEHSATGALEEGLARVERELALARYRVELRELEELRVVEADGRLTEARGRLDDLRAERTRLMDDHVEQARRSDAERRALIEEKDALIEEIARSQRDQRLQVARLESFLALVEQRLADVELRLPVTLEVTDAHLHEVLRQLHEQTGVSLSAPGDGSGALPRISLRCEARPLAEVLDVVAFQCRLRWVHQSAPGPVAVDEAPPEVRFGDREALRLGVCLARVRVVSSDSGLLYQDLVPGHGRPLGAGQAVVVHYTGWLTTGARFDSSHDRGQALRINLGAGQVIKGWEGGLQGMLEGGVRRLIIPPQLAYGDRGVGDIIPPDATLVFEVEALGIDWSVRPDAATRREVERVLRERRLSCRFDQAPLEEALSFLRDVTGLEVVAAPRVDLTAPLSLVVRDESLASVVEQLCAAAGLDWTVRYQTLYLHPADQPPGSAAPVPVTRDSLPHPRMATQVSLAFEDQHLEDALDFLRDLTGLNVVLSRGAYAELRRGPRADLRVREVRLHSALSLLTEQFGLTWRMDDDEVVWVLAPREEPPPRRPLGWASEPLGRPISVNFQGTPIGEALNFLRDVTGLNVALTREAFDAVDEERPLHMVLREVPLHRALSAMAQQAGLAWSVDPEGGALLLVTGADELPQPMPGERPAWLTSRLVTTNLADTPLTEVLEFLEQISGLSFRAGQAVDASQVRVHLRLREVPLDCLLDAIGYSADLTWRVDGEGVVVFERG
jgi:FKBP-type peptidyl-prolyl cis-trans isomerase FkpA